MKSIIDFTVIIDKFIYQHIFVKNGTEYSFLKFFCLVFLVLFCPVSVAPKIQLNVGKDNKNC